MTNLRRFRNAAITCFVAAVLLLVVAALRGNPYSEFTQSAASLGASFWLIGLALTFAVVFLRGRFRAAD